MTKIQNPKREYDLEERTSQFAKAVRLFVKTEPRTIANIESLIRVHLFLEDTIKFFPGFPLDPGSMPAVFQQNESEIF